jgi:hypothetical protein
LKALKLEYPKVTGEVKKALAAARRGLEKE